MKDYYCTWLYHDVRPSPVTCFWLFGKSPECSSYVERDKGRCIYLTEKIE